MGNHLFVIFAVLDVSLAVNLCINCSFFTFIRDNSIACFLFLGSCFEWLQYLIG